MYDDSEEPRKWPEHLMSVREVADEWGVEPRMLRHWIDAGMTPAVAATINGQDWLHWPTFEQWWQAMKGMFSVLDMQWEARIAERRTTMSGSTDHDTLLTVPECLKRGPADAPAILAGADEAQRSAEIKSLADREPRGKAGLVEAAEREGGLAEAVEHASSLAPTHTTIKQPADADPVHEGQPAALAVVTTFPPQAHPVPVMRGNVMFCPNFMGAAVVVEDTEDDNKLVCGFCRVPAHKPDHRPLLRITNIELDEHSKGRD